MQPYQLLPTIQDYFLQILSFLELFAFLNVLSRVIVKVNEQNLVLNECEKHVAPPSLPLKVARLIAIVQGYQFNPLEMHDYVQNLTQSVIV